MGDQAGHLDRRLIGGIGELLGGYHPAASELLAQECQRMSAQGKTDEFVCRLFGLD
jgi:hypothetical protein